jgi:hypothetical protein
VLSTLLACLLHQEVSRRLYQANFEHHTNWHMVPEVADHIPTSRAKPTQPLSGHLGPTLLACRVNSHTYGQPPKTTAVCMTQSTCEASNVGEKSTVFASKSSSSMSSAADASRHSVYLMSTAARREHTQQHRQDLP